jgi:predicted ferric reductase
LLPEVVVWELIRASGLLAYLFLSAAVALGIAVRVRALDWLLKRAWVFELHQVISVLALALTVTHVLLLFANNHVRFDVFSVLIPFVSPWRPLATALGILGFYLLGLLVLTSYTRSFIGQKAWRAVHFGGFAAWVMALGHGLAAGTDSGAAGVQYMYLATGTLVVMLIAFRVLDAPAPGTAARTADRAARAADGAATRRP